MRAEEETDSVEIFADTPSALVYDLKSPGDPSQVGISPLDSGLSFLQDIPGSCVSFAYHKISSELLKNSVSASASALLTEYTTSSQLSCHYVDYVDWSPRSKTAYNRRNLIEEISETEESYISSLRMLSGIYLESLINKGNNGIPIRLLRQYVDLLISAHTDFLFDLRNLSSIAYRATFDHFVNEEFNQKAKSLISISSPLMAALVAELVSKRAISVFMYQEYYSIHDLVLKLMDSVTDEESGLTLTKGFQQFLEASQDDKMDLSFTSLIHKPIQRISKYKLFLESLAKLTPTEEEDDCHQKILDCSVQVDYSIREINRYGLQEKIRANTLFENLVFTSITLKFPVEYLGLPLLLGSVSCIWVGRDGMIQSQNLGAFLFKTHLILTNVSKNNRYEVVFLIPLSVSRLIDDNDYSNNNVDGGLFSTHPHSFKILFEHHYTLFEIMVVASEKVISIWKNRLDILINFVNGPYKFNYSASEFNEEQGTQSSTILPPYMHAYDAKLDKFKNFRTTGTLRNITRENIFNRCYFGKVLPIKIKVLEADGYGSLRFKPYDPELVVIRQSDVRKLEFLLEDITSEELLMNSEKLTQKRNNFSSKSKEVIDKSNQAPTRDKSIRRSTLRSTTSTKMSLMRKTSLIFGDALKSVFQGGDAS